MQSSAGQPELRTYDIESVVTFVMGFGGSLHRDFPSGPPASADPAVAHRAQIKG